MRQLFGSDCWVKSDRHCALKKKYLGLYWHIYLYWFLPTAINCNFRTHDCDKTSNVKWDFSLASVCCAGASGTRGWLEVPGNHSHPGGEEKRESQDPLCQEKDGQEADQGCREERRDKDCKIHRRSETIWNPCLSWSTLANKVNKCL